MASYNIPVEMNYNGRKYIATMGPFQHSTEREFALTVNKRAIHDCSDINQLKPVALNLLQGWCSMQTAFQSIMLENIELRQALDGRDQDLKAAEELMIQAGNTIEQMRCERQSMKAMRLPWPFG
jgi:hypothetical protein